MGLDMYITMTRNRDICYWRKAYTLQDTFRELARKKGYPDAIILDKYELFKEDLDWIVNRYLDQVSRGFVKDDYNPSETLPELMKAYTYLLGLDGDDSERIFYTECY